MTKPTLKALDKAFDNTTKAYQELNPGTDYSTASTLGLKGLRKQKKIKLT